MIPKIIGYTLRIAVCYESPDYSPLKRLWHDWQAKVPVGYNRMHERQAIDATVAKHREWKGLFAIGGCVIGESAIFEGEGKG